MSYICWLNDPQLFLYAKGTGTSPDDVLLRRCKKPVSSSSLVVPMKSEDFDYVSNVENHLELIDDQFDWDETDYKRLVKYIYERLLLVNRQGLVIAEIYKLDDPNEVPIYIRSLDVLPMKPYIPNIRERLIPLRTVKYLEDVNGKAAMMEEKDSNEITKLTARVENLEAENSRLESKNNTLDTSVTQLTAGLATITGNVVDLQSKNKTLEAENKTLDSNIKTLEAKNKTLDSNIKTLEAENKTLDSNIKTLEAENKTLDSNVKTLEGKVTKLAKELVTQMNALTTLQQKMKNINTWMNDLTNSEWVGIEGLKSAGPLTINIVGQLGTFTVDDSSTNVQAGYWYKVQLRNGLSYYGEFKVVSHEDLTPNKERSRFSPGIWASFQSNGKTYAYRGG